MPIYEFACPKCRVVFNFLSPRVNPDRLPTCPRCGNRKLTKELSTFATLSGKSAGEPYGEAPAAGTDDGMDGPNLDDPKIQKVMGELERDMAGMDDNNPKHMAHMMRKMKELMPAGTVPKDLDIAIKRLESGESPEKIEEDMGDVLDGMMGGAEDGTGKIRGVAKSDYTRDSGLYDY